MWLKNGSESRKRRKVMTGRFLDKMRGGWIMGKREDEATILL